VLGTLSEWRSSANYSKGEPVVTQGKEGRKRGLVLLISVLALLGIAASAAQAAESSIYVARGPGYRMTLRAEGGHVFAVSLVHRVYCEYRAEGEVQTQEANDVSFSPERPKEFERAGGHIYLAEHETTPFEDHDLVIDGDIHYTGIVGYFKSSNSGEGLGGECRSGGFKGSPRVQFEAVRYAPYDSNPIIGTGPDRSAERLYFADDGRVEAYFWVGDDSVTEILGTSQRACLPRARREFVSRGAIDEFVPPLPLSAPGGRFRARSASDSRPVATAHIFGTVGEWGLVGGLRERVVEKQRDHSYLLCWLGPRRGNGYRHFHATRYMQVPPREASESEE
jgi:hypothetical protein